MSGSGAAPATLPVKERRSASANAMRGSEGFYLASFGRGFASAGMGWRWTFKIIDTVV